MNNRLNILLALFAVGTYRRLIVIFFIFAILVAALALSYDREIKLSKQKEQFEQE